ncbi:hypothetical protein GUITHDRAFT_117588 [Guillardia theta CCMP2712]|uniref:Uncharacterized protein n=1 Tax=Guillardia theta (strain CCMP2712) TaxID=905079 RepID=L1IJ12_GUITC|nr:hypothetical protein GUITHDRAFT_117588 [Guillardia theta CCMP2712]EKX36231.1 hypothetical protein GUITHDRAFT_117588 [Guillardia theta CCMP2712]|eukprot:XP_005823211.1 hypothetical protein GUITHDRAFT_117588 [Guillardia theta CCMP2712]
MLGAAMHKALSYAATRRRCRDFKIICEQRNDKWLVGIGDDGEGFLFESIEEEKSWLSAFVSNGICQNARMADDDEKTEGEFSSFQTVGTQSSNILILTFDGSVGCLQGHAALEEFCVLLQRLNPATVGMCEA